MFNNEHGQMSTTGRTLVKNRKPKNYLKENFATFTATNKNVLYSLRFRKSSLVSKKQIFFTITLLSIYLFVVYQDPICNKQLEI